MIHPRHNFTMNRLGMVTMKSQAQSIASSKQSKLTLAPTLPIVKAIDTVEVGV